jgi:hypothetical protein
MKPLTRRDGLLLRELPDELLVYDTKQHRAHCLNRTAATVFCRADGTRTVADLGRLLDPDAPRPAGEAAVLMALERLDEAGLLEGGPYRPALSRRDVVRRVGLGAALLLPAVASIVAPTPAEAAVTGCIDASVSGACVGHNGEICTCDPINDPCTLTGPGVCSGGTCTAGC